MINYDFVNNSFTTYKDVPKPVKITNIFSDDGYDIAPDFISDVTATGIPIAKPLITIDNTPEHVYGQTQQPVEPQVSTSFKRRLGQKEKEKAMLVMNGLIKRGIDPPQAAGIAGSMVNESGLDPKKYSKNDLGTPSVGLAQWKDDRYIKLRNFASSKNKSWEDLDIQLDYLVQSIDSDTKLKLESSKTPSEAAKAWANYERFAGYDGTTKTAQKLKRSKGWTEEQTKKWVDDQHKSRGDYAEEIYELWKLEGKQR